MHEWVFRSGLDHWVGDPGAGSKVPISRETCCVRWHAATPLTVTRSVSAHACPVQATFIGMICAFVYKPVSDWVIAAEEAGAFKPRRASPPLHVLEMESVLDELPVDVECPTAHVGIPGSLPDITRRPTHVCRLPCGATGWRGAASRQETQP